ncbi:hypothetical protein [Natrinema pallidum]|uniref:Uncharacterized protein n=1 Tax=Natrinema pallidum DSM 3751 TaxID=1227495 RepID=L9YJX7_9EURY|nr:hypothetical protein C487_17590 [Natrinema pallidum DSM 3751]
MQDSETQDKFKTVERDLEMGEMTVTMAFGGVCHRCGDETLEAANHEEFGRMRCSSCGLVIGPTVRPTVGEDGEPATEDEEWPYERLEFELNDAPATVGVRARGDCSCGGTLRSNTEDAQFGRDPLTCSSCHGTVGWAVQYNIVKDPASEADSE